MPISFTPTAYDFSKVPWLLLLLVPVFLFDIEHVEGGAFLLRVHVLAPLFEPLYFFDIIKIFASFRLNDVVFLRRDFHDKVGIVVPDVAVGVPVIYLEVNSKIIFRI